MRARIPALLVAGLIASGCGGSSDNKDGGGGDIPQIRGGERLGWVQAAATPQQLQALTYRLYVSGNPASLNGVRCAQTAGASGYECSGVLPPMSVGPHDLELTSLQQGVESARSPRLSVNVVSSTSTSPSSSSTSDGGGTTALTACSSGSPRSCFAVTRVMASGLSDASLLTPTPDGRLLFAEGSKRIRIIDNQNLQAEPALELDAGARIAGMTTDRDFSTSHAVFIAWQERTSRGGDVLNISRYREVGNTLGEAAAVVSGLPFRADGLAPLAVGADGFLYVALPSSSAAKDETGLVLRFTRDGQIPKDNPNALPIIAAGYSHPTGVAVDRSGGRIWLAGDSQQLPYGISTLATSADPHARWWLAAPTLPAKTTSADRFRSAALAMTDAASGEPPRLVITSLLRLYEASVGENGAVSSINEIIFDKNATVLSASPGPQNTIYVALRDPAGSNSIIQLQRR